MSRCVDLTGKNFGRLTVRERWENYISPKGNQEAQWICDCECGNEVVVRGSFLRGKQTQSCGCLATETKSKVHKKYNKYDTSDDCGIGYTTNGEKFYFDLEDYDLIKEHCWHINKSGYVVTNIRKNKKNTGLSMHRLVMACNESNINIDHINHVRHDNRKSNLRRVTPRQNSLNISLQKNNTSGVTGVHLDKKSNKWIAQITINGKLSTIGTCDTFEEAKEIRLKAEDKYYGEYSYHNSMKNAVAIE